MNGTLQQALNKEAVRTALADDQVPNEMYRSFHAARAPTNEVYEELSKFESEYNGHNQAVYKSHLSELNKTLQQESADQKQLRVLEEHISKLKQEFEQRDAAQKQQQDVAQIEMIAYQRIYEISNAQMQLDSKLRLLEERTKAFQEEHVEHIELLKKFEEQQAKIDKYVRDMKRNKVIYEEVEDENTALRKEITQLTSGYRNLEAEVLELYRDKYPEPEEDLSESETLKIQIENGSVISNLDEMDEKPRMKTKKQKVKAQYQQPSSTSANSASSSSVSQSSGTTGKKGNSQAAKKPSAADIDDEKMVGAQLQNEGKEFVARPRTEQPKQDAKSIYSQGKKQSKQ